MAGSPFTRSATPLDGRDDVDRLYQRLSTVPPPRDFSAGVLLAIRTQRLSRTQILWLVAQMLAVICLTALAWVVGQALVGTGTLDLVSALVSNPDVAGAGGMDPLAVLAGSVPWLELAGLGITLVAVGICTRGLVRALGQTPGSNARAARPPGGLG